jgi:hypothetical protein
MPRRITQFAVVGVLLATAILVPAIPGRAANHLWDFTEVFSNADGSVQFIELRSSGPSENFVDGQFLRSNGANYEVTTNLPGGNTSNRHFLFGTAAYAALPGAAAPDYIIPANFFAPTSDILKWGNWDTFPVSSVPTDGLMSLLRNGTTASNAPMNFANNLGHVDARAPVPGDTNNDRLVNVVDLNNVRNNFGSASLDILGDTNNDDKVDIADLNAVRNNFGEGAAIAVPEPAGVAIAMMGLVSAALIANRQFRRSSRH